MSHQIRVHFGKMSYFHSESVDMINMDCSEVKTETNIKKLMIQSTKLVLSQTKLSSYTIQNQQLENEHVYVLREIATNLQH